MSKRKKTKAVAEVRHIAFEEALIDLGLSVNADEKVVIREFKKTVKAGDKALGEFRTNTKKCAEFAYLLVHFFGNTQEQAGEKLGFSQPWVSGVLAWRAKGFPDVIFVPSIPKALSVPNKTSDPNAPKVQTSDGVTLDLSNVSSKVKEQLDALNDNEDTADGQPAGDEGTADGQPAGDQTGDDEAAKNNAAKIAEEAAVALRAEKDFAVTFFHSTPKTAIQRACYELLNNKGAKPEDLFVAVAEVIMPRVNSGTKAWIIKQAQAVRPASFGTLPHGENKLTPEITVAPNPNAKDYGAVEVEAAA